jgi:hypothetical protein
MTTLQWNSAYAGDERLKSRPTAHRRIAEWISVGRESVVQLFGALILINQSIFEQARRCGGVSRPMSNYLGKI